MANFSYTFIQNHLKEAAYKACKQTAKEQWEGFIVRGVGCRVPGLGTTSDGAASEASHQRDRMRTRDTS